MIIWLNGVSEWVTWLNRIEWWLFDCILASICFSSFFFLACSLSPSWRRILYKIFISRFVTSLSPLLIHSVIFIIIHSLFFLYIKMIIEDSMTTKIIIIWCLWWSFIDRPNEWWWFFGFDRIIWCGCVFSSEKKHFAMLVNQI